MIFQIGQNFHFFKTFLKVKSLLYVLFKEEVPYQKRGGIRFTIKGAIWWRLVWKDQGQGGWAWAKTDDTATPRVTSSSSKEPLELPQGPITQARAKRFKEAISALVDQVWG